MPQLIISINYEVPDNTDADATPVRRRRDVDLLAELTTTQQATIVTLMTRIRAAVFRRYGAEANIEGMQFVPDAPVARVV